MRNRRVEARRFLGETDEGVALALDALAQFLDFPLRLEDPSRFVAAAARNEVRPAEYVSRACHDRERRRAAGIGRQLVRIGNPRLAERLANRDRVGPGHLHDRGQRDEAFVRGPSRRTCGAVVDDGGRHQESAAAGARLAYELEAGTRLMWLFDDHVLEQIAETRLDRALVAGVDVEVVGNRTHLTDRAVRLGEHRTWRVAVPGARGFELFERR